MSDLCCRRDDNPIHTRGYSPHSFYVYYSPVTIRMTGVLIVRVTYRRKNRDFARSLYPCVSLETVTLGQPVEDPRLYVCKNMERQKTLSQWTVRRENRPQSPHGLGGTKP